MNISIDIARRYLFGKKNTNAINLITGISIAGMTIGTAALLLILSVFNGFEDLISKLMNSYNPDIKVVAKSGVYIKIDSSTLTQIYQIPGIDKISSTLEEVVLFEYDGSQEAGFLKGVDEHFNEVTNIDSTIIRGEYITSDAKLNYGILGSGMFNKLSVNPSDPITPITVYAALKSKGPLSQDYSTADLYPAGVFTVGSDEDAQYILTNIEFVRTLINNDEAVTSIEIKVKKGYDEKNIEQSISTLLGSNVVIKNRYRQDEAFLKIMNIEKWISYLIACLTLGLISFNLVGALWMIVLDKKRDISVLKSMGMTTFDVRRLIIYLGVLIGFIGLLSGLIVAAFLYVLQKQYDLVSVPPGFLIDAYPISMRFPDILLVSVTVLTLAGLASILPASRASKISAFVRHE